jgi:hypothetical protein
LHLVDLDCLKAQAGKPKAVAVRRYVATTADGLIVEPPPLGTFQPTPYIIVRGNGPAGGGYSPLGTYGEQNMVLYGPFSPLRSTSAPVASYVRGYDGVLLPVSTTSFSNPMLPPLSPVVYPTPLNNFYGPRNLKTPPAWNSGIDWIDQR